MVGVTHRHSQGGSTALSVVPVQNDGNTTFLFYFVITVAIDGNTAVSASAVLYVTAIRLLSPLVIVKFEEKIKKNNADLLMTVITAVQVPISELNL